MEIAKGIQAKSYLGLDLLDKSNKDWDIAFEFLNKRLNERFIEPADKLIELESDLPPSKKKYGFAILALDCLLSETIQAFYEGVKDSTGKSKQLFVSFLQQRENFKQYFSDEQEATKFYKDFRCGILHQAQTSKDTKVWTVGVLIRKVNSFIIVNRDLYHENIKKELNIYIGKLKKKTDTLLMDNFKSKMDFIAGKA